MGGADSAAGVAGSERFAKARWCSTWSVGYNVPEKLDNILPNFFGRIHSAER